MKLSYKKNISVEISQDEAFLNNLIQIIEANLENEQFGVKDLAMKMNLSRIQVYRKIQSLRGKTVSRFIREIRLEKAMELLVRDIATVSEIAYSVGFGSPTYFNKCFHEYYGFPPGEFKKKGSKASQTFLENQSPASKQFNNTQKKISPSQFLLL